MSFRNIAAVKGRIRGFTFVELLVIVAVTAILAAVALPGFAPLLESWRIRQAVHDLESTMYLARSEAIRRGGGVVLRKNPQDTDGCTQAGAPNLWGCGWSLFVDANGNGTLDADEELLQTNPPPQALAVIQSHPLELLQFDRYGLPGLNMVGFVVSPARTTSSSATRTLCFASGGRIKIIESANCD